MILPLTEISMFRFKKSLKEYSIVTIFHLREKISVYFRYVLHTFFDTSSIATSWNTIFISLKTDFIVYVALGI